MNEYIVFFADSFQYVFLYGDSINDVFETAKRDMPGRKVVAVYEEIFKRVGSDCK